MRLGFEKAKRRDLARGGYRSLTGLRDPTLKKFKKRKRFRGRHRWHKPSKCVPRDFNPKTKVPGPDIQRTLTVFCSPPAYARFARIKGRWACIEADPVLDWMLRVRHLEQIRKWLALSHLGHDWSVVTPFSAKPAISNKGGESPPEDPTVGPFPRTSRIPCRAGREVASLNKETDGRPGQLSGRAVSLQAGRLNHSSLRNPVEAFQTEAQGVVASYLSEQDSTDIRTGPR